MLSAADPQVSTDLIRSKKSTTTIGFATDDFGQSGAGTPTNFMNVVGIGIPYLAFNFKVNKKFLLRHELKVNEFYIFPSSSKEILEEAMQEYGDQLQHTPVRVGGISLDIAQTIQWISPSPKCVVFLGPRALDKDAVTLLELCRKTEIGFRLEDVENITSSVALALHLKAQYCEVFFVDKKTNLSTAFMDKSSITKLLERANVIYTSDISMLLMPKANQKLAYFSCSRFNHFFVILHRPKCLIKAKDEIYAVLCYTDILFLNPECAATFIKVYNVPQPNTCCKRCRRAWDIYLFMKKLSKKSCTVIVSDGLTSAVVHTDLSSGKSSKYKSRFYRRSKIVDSFGIQRAFVGGFLAMMIQGYHIDPCVECGFFCSSVASSIFGSGLPQDVDTKTELVSKWYNHLDRIIAERCASLSSKRESTMPFTMFHTPWKETEVISVFTESCDCGQSI